jgi:hypothetical protein
VEPKEQKATLEQKERKVIREPKETKDRKETKVGGEVGKAGEDLDFEFYLFQIVVWSII